MKRIDSHLNWIFRRFFEWIEKKVFSGWQDIHPMGFEKSEEDEGIWALQMMSPAIGLMCPWFKEMDWICLADHLSEKKKERMMSFYKNTLQRFAYAWGKDKTILVKNVLSTGRINMIMKTFPDARIIYPLRNPYQIVPSMTSMFTSPWPFIAPKIQKNSPEYRTWGDIIILFYRHFMDEIKKYNPDKFYSCTYEELMDHPKDLVLEIYDHFGFNASDEFLQRLIEETTKAREYKSKHEYSLEEYGYTMTEIYTPLKDVFEQYKFKA